MDIPALTELEARFAVAVVSAPPPPPTQRRRIVVSAAAVVASLLAGPTAVSLISHDGGPHGDPAAFWGRLAQTVLWANPAEDFTDLALSAEVIVTATVEDIVAGPQVPTPAPTDPNRPHNLELLLRVETSATDDVLPGDLFVLKLINFGLATLEEFRDAQPEGPATYFLTRGEGQDVYPFTDESVIVATDHGLVAPMDSLPEHGFVRDLPQRNLSELLVAARAEWARAAE